MDDKLKILGVESMPYAMLEKLKIEKMAIESQPEPEKPTLFQEYVQEETLTLKNEIDVILNRIADSSKRDAANDSNEEIVKRGREYLRKYSSELVTPFLMLTHLEQFRLALEKQAHGRDYSTWQGRFKAIDSNIQSWKSKIAKPFDASLINIETCEKIIPGNKALRWPIDRCKQVDGKWADAWLTDFLHSKPILFNSSQYADELIKFYQTVYLKQAEIEQKQTTQQAAEQKQQEQAKQPEPQPTGDAYRIPQAELNAIREQDEERSSLWQGSRRLGDLRR